MRRDVEHRQGRCKRSESQTSAMAEEGRYLQTLPRFQCSGPRASLIPKKKTTLPRRQRDRHCRSLLPRRSDPLREFLLFTANHASNLPCNSLKRCPSLDFIGHDLPVRSSFGNNADENKSSCGFGCFVLRAGALRSATKLSLH
jgi:hypothetical protein